MVTNFNEYATGEAFCFYVVHIFENGESWNEIKDEMVSRFKVCNPSIIHQLETFQLGPGSDTQCSRSNHHQ